MSEDKQLNSQIAGKSLFLDTVIDCITESRNSPSKKQQNLQQENTNLNVLYNKAGSIISQLDGSINRCIKYNEAKTNRKYEIIITDLQTQIKRLSQKLKLQQDARSPTKKHISDILDKLVIFRDENNKLKEEIKTKDKKIAELQKMLSEQTKALQKIETQQPKTIIERLPPVSGVGTVCQAIKNFLKDKEVVKKLTNKSSSKLQKFLWQNKAKSWNWTVPVLLQELQKWSEGISVEKNDVDMWRIRSNIARKFSDYIDDSNNLTKPSRLNSISVTQQVTPRQNKYLTSRKVSDAFSYKGSKQRLNLSVI